MAKMTANRLKQSLPNIPAPWSSSPDRGFSSASAISSPSFSVITKGQTSLITSAQTAMTHGEDVIAARAREPLSVEEVWKKLVELFDGRVTEMKFERVQKVPVELLLEQLVPEA